MATDLRTKINLSVAATERELSLGSGSVPSSLRHLAALAATYVDGTDANENDTVYSISTTVTSASPDDYDVRGGLTSVLTGDAIDFAEITLIVLKNESTTSTENVSLGGGSNPVGSLWMAAGDGMTVGPGGILIWTSPIDGAACTAGTADGLRISTTSATAVAYSMLIIGRSA